MLSFSINNNTNLFCWSSESVRVRLFCLISLICTFTFLPIIFQDLKPSNIAVNEDCELKVIWAAAWQNQQNDLCRSAKLRSAWASAQSDQSSLSAWRNIGPLTTYWAHSETDQTERMPRLVWVFSWRPFHFVGFVVQRLIYSPFLECGTGNFLNRKVAGNMYSECSKGASIW